MQNTLKEIENDLRRAMNGVIANSMREKGIVYKLNFGVALPEIKEIARKYDKDAALAEALWQEDIREFNILATLLQPVDSFSSDQAKRWISEIPYQEVAEQLCVNLLKELPYAEHLVLEYFFKEKRFDRIVAFLLAAQLCKNGYQLQAYTIYALLGVGRHVMDRGVSVEQQSVMIALKQFGRQSPHRAAQVLSVVEEYKGSGHPEQEEFYNDLKFEFEYYH